MKNMPNADDFLYVRDRGKLLLKGQTSEDRRCALTDCIFSWIYRLLIALALLVTAIGHVINHSDGHSDGHFKRVEAYKTTQR